MAEKNAPPINIDEILIAEFEYIAGTANQTNEDRARVTSFYLVSFGSFIAALLSAQFTSQNGAESWIQWGFAILFIALAALGTLTAVQLARLRMAWFDSARAMNQIKRYYTTRAEGAKLAEAFRFSEKSLPHPFKINSVAFVMVLEVAVLAGISFGAACWFANTAAGNTSLIWPESIIGFFFGLVQILLYRFLLK